jgi:hypothetical protein
MMKPRRDPYKRALYLAAKQAKADGSRPNSVTFDGWTALVKWDDKTPRILAVIQERGRKEPMPNANDMKMTPWNGGSV